MRIIVIIDSAAFHPIRLPINANCQIATFFVFHVKLALPARRFHNLHFLLGLLRLETVSEQNHH